MPSRAKYLSLMPSLRLTAFACSAVLVLAACAPQGEQDDLAKGKQSAAAGDHRAAAVHFKNALQAKPDASDVRVLLGQSLLATGDPLGALVEFNRALEQRADPAEVLPSLASAMMQANQARKLVDLHADTEVADPKARAEFLTTLAAAWSLQRRADKADAAISAALQAAPGSPRVLSQKARLLLLRGELSAAKAVIEPVTVAHPGHAEAWHLLGDIMAAQKAEPQAVEAILRKALDLDPKYLQAQSSMVASRVRARDLPGARAELQKLQAILPGGLDAEFLGAQIAYFEGNFRQAREGAQQVLKLLPDNVGALQLAAAVEWQIGSLALAERHLSSALREDPSLDDARLNLAQIYLRLGQPARALSAVEPLLKRAPPVPRALAVAGEASLQQGDPESAEKFYRAASQAVPQDGRARTALALTQLSLGNAGAAFGQLEALASETKDGYADIALISARLQRNQLDEALAAVNRLVDKRKDVANAHQLKGAVLMARGELAEARKSYDTALTLDPRSLASVTGLAEIDVREGRSAEAAKRYSSYLAAEPGNHLAVVALAEPRLRAGVPVKEVIDSLAQVVKLVPDEPAPRLKMIEMLAGRRQLKAALAAAQEAAATMPDNTDVLDALGRMLALDGNHQQALSTFRRITIIDPNSGNAYARMGELHLADGNRTAALASYRRALELEPRSKIARTRLVDMLVDDKRSKEALQIARDMQTRDPASAGGYLLEAAVHRKLKNNAATIPVYQAGIKRASEPAELALNLFVALLASGDWKQAETLAKQHLSAHSSDSAMHYTLGEAYMARSENANAERHFQEATRLRSDQPNAWNNLAWVLLQQRKPGAVEAARRAVELAPDHAAMVDTLAAALAASGQVAEALAEQKKAVQLAPTDAGVRLRLAEIAIGAGDRTLAKSELQRLVDANQKGSIRDRAASLLAGL